MNYYPHNIGDYAAATRHLSLLEHGVYRSLLDLYYLDEQPLPADPGKLCRLVAARGEEEKAAVRIVAEEFFQVVDGLLRHKRCDVEIAHFHALAERNRINGRKGGRPRQFGGQSSAEPDGQPDGDPGGGANSSEVPRETLAAGNPDQTQPYQSRLSETNPSTTQDEGNQDTRHKNQETRLTNSADAPGKEKRTAAKTQLSGNGEPKTAQLNGPPPGNDRPLVDENMRPLFFMPKGFSISPAVRQWAQQNGYDRLDRRFKHFVRFARRRAAMYADWDEALISAISDDWARLGGTGAPVSYLGEGEGI